MSFDAPFVASRNVAVIGGGISGLASAYLLSKTAKVTLLEKDARLGGHARTIIAGKNGGQPVDTGFIVFNFVNYPHLTRFFKDLDVPIQRSNMSFGVSIDDGRLEYGLSSLSSLFAQKENLANPAFIAMVCDIIRFNAKAEQTQGGHNQSIGDLVTRMRLGKSFQDNYLIPICGAIWSTPSSEILDFPAEALINFLKNHALMSSSGQHQWWTVSGGSTEYVRRAKARLQEDGVEIKTNSRIATIKRDAFGATICFADGSKKTFDEVVFATHPDQALALLERPTDKESRTLGSIRFQDNRAVLHCDTAQMPANKACWSSWIYQADTTKPSAQVGVTYWMNQLQNIRADDPHFVSLNPTKDVDPSKIYDEKTFRHPIFDQAAAVAQTEIAAMQGQNKTWFAGAWMRNGFHEDGFASAVRIARQMQKEMV
jgi:predicted NAD/FAD-binding protein